MQILSARNLHYLFQASLLFKAAIAASETVSGLGLLLTPSGAISAWVAWMAHSQLSEAPADSLVLAVQQMFAATSLESQHFYALYLLVHGMLKLAMVVTLGRRLPWAYPASMIILAGFVIYQTSVFLQGGGAVLGLLSALDLLMIVLVWREYRLLSPQHA